MCIRDRDKGDWTLGPTLNIYAHTGDGAVVGIGASARYNILDALRIEPVSYTHLDVYKRQVLVSYDYAFKVAQFLALPTKMKVL